MKKKINLQLFSSKKINTNIKTDFKVKNEVDSDVAELYLYGTIRQAYPWDDEDSCISSERVLNALKEIGDKDVKVHINSGGGDVFESIAIHNTLKQHKGKVHIVIDALAGSGASVIAMAGDTIVMFETSMMMIHKSWTIAMGNADNLRKYADDLDKIDMAVKASYKNRFVGTDEELENLIADESWLTYDECEAFGFCDTCIESQSDPEPQNNIKENLFNKYRKEPISIKSNLFNKFKTGVDD